MFSSKEIRQKYLDFFKSRGHIIISSASLFPENDPTTLFTGSGMQPLVSYLLGEIHPQGKRLVNSQKCFRAEDIEEVGDSRHTTFFEMLGNWSLGDYFKKEQLEWIFTFLVKELRVDPKRLYVTVFRGNRDLGIARDKEAVEIWKRLFSKVGLQALDLDFAEKNGMQGARIFYYGEEQNWWSRAGSPAKMPVGEPGGPDSEIFYDLGENLRQHQNSSYKNQLCHVNCECGRFIEIGNSVFMQYIKTEKGFQELKQKNIDFGGGLERIAMVLQGKSNVFEIDIFKPLISKIEEMSGRKYKGNLKPFEIIADHLRAATFIMGDNKGLKPSNTGQGYIVRRLIRRAMGAAREFKIRNKIWLGEIAQIIIKNYSALYPELKKNSQFILEQLRGEEIKFQKALEVGLKEFEKLSLKKEITGKEAFDLYQTYGFPLEMTSELAKSKGIKVDKLGFQKEFLKHQELSRTSVSGKFRGGLADAGEQTMKLHTATHLLLAALRKVLGKHVMQKGSNITAERLRLDFSHPKKMTPEELRKVENLVGEAIEKDLPITKEELPLEEAKRKGALGVFESRYGNIVKIYKIGKGKLGQKSVFSYEICGGPHVARTGSLGHFKIIKEESSSAGIRRIKATLE